MSSIFHYHPDTAECWWDGVNWIDAHREVCKDNDNSGPINTNPRKAAQAEPVDAWSLDLNGLMNEVGILMRDRHRKYGNGNISKRGIPGILVRLDDKLARIDNGDLDYADESYRDAWLDVVGYGLVALMCLDGNWPNVEKPSRDRVQ